MRAYTIPIPVTARDPVPATVAVVPQSNGGALAYAGRRRLSKERLSVALHRRFGNRARWPMAQGRLWVAYIQPPAPLAASAAAAASVQPVVSGEAI